MTTELKSIAENQMKTANNAKIRFRQAKTADVAELMELEKTVWGAGSADEVKISSRINAFPAGNWVAEYQKKIVGYMCFQYVNDLTEASKCTWADITDNGKTTESHQPNGQYIFGINLSCHPCMKGNNLGTKMLTFVWADLISQNKKGMFVGSRIPDFCDYKAEHPEITAQEYITLKKNEKHIDCGLRLYAREGMQIVKLVPDYFPDPASMNYGVLFYRKNPFYNWPFKRFWKWLIVNMLPVFIRS
jgi:hypothetical protein